MTAAVDRWRHAILERAAWRVAAGLASADERDRLYAALRRLPRGPERERLAAAVRVGLELGIPDEPSVLERAHEVAPRHRPDDWADALSARAAPRELDNASARADAYDAIAALATIDPDAADRALEELLTRLGRERPVPAPVPIEVELLIGTVTSEPPLASARELLAAAARGTVEDWQLARAVRDTRAAAGEPWASWLAWTATALQRTIPDTV